MASEEMKGPTFSGIEATGCDSERRTVFVRFAGADGRSYGTHFALSLVGPTLLALQDEAGRLASTLPEEEASEIVPLQGTSFVVAESERANPMILWTLAGAATVAIEFEPADLSKIIEELQALQLALRGKAH